MTNATQGRRPTGPGWYWRVIEDIGYAEPCEVIEGGDSAGLKYRLCGRTTVYRVEDDSPLVEYTPLAPPPDIRLCRAVPGPQWSQEPPTEAGDWWIWDAMTGSKRGRLVRTWRPSQDQPLMLTVDNIHYTVKRYCRDTLTLWWLPATVPQPPGEVGE